MTTTCLLSVSGIIFGRYGKHTWAVGPAYQRSLQCDVYTGEKRLRD